MTSSSRLFLCPAIEAIDSQPDCSCAWNQDLALFLPGSQDYVKGIFALPIVSRQKTMKYPFFFLLCIFGPFGKNFKLSQTHLVNNSGTLLPWYLGTCISWVVWRADLLLSKGRPVSLILEYTLWQISSPQNPEVVPQALQTKIQRTYRNVVSL